MAKPNDRLIRKIEKIWRNRGSASIFQGTDCAIAMGPTLEHSFTVHAGIVPGSRPWTARSFKIPFQHLNRSVQSLHSRGLSIQGMGSSVVPQNLAPSPEAVAKSVTSETAKPESTPKKAARRNSKRRRS